MQGSGLKLTEVMMCERLLLHFDMVIQGVGRFWDRPSLSVWQSRDLSCVYHSGISVCSDSICRIPNYSPSKVVRDGYPKRDPQKSFISFTEEVLVGKQRKGC